MRRAIRGQPPDSEPAGTREDSAGESGDSPRIASERPSGCATYFLEENGGLRTARGGVWGVLGQTASAPQCVCNAFATRKRVAHALRCSVKRL